MLSFSVALLVFEKSTKIWGTMASSLRGNGQKLKPGPLPSPRSSPWAWGTSSGGRGITRVRLQAHSRTKIFFANCFQGPKRTLGEKKAQFVWNMVQEYNLPMGKALKGPLWMVGRKYVYFLDQEQQIKAKNQVLVKIKQIQDGLKRLPILTATALSNKKVPKANQAYARLKGHQVVDFKDIGIPQVSFNPQVPQVPSGL